jgi:hypothetical protein
VSVHKSFKYGSRLMAVVCEIMEVFCKRMERMTLFMLKLSSRCASFEDMMVFHRILRETNPREISMSCLFVAPNVWTPFSDLLQVILGFHTEVPSVENSLMWLLQLAGEALEL